MKKKSYEEIKKYEGEKKEKKFRFGSNKKKEKKILEIGRAKD